MSQEIWRLPRILATTGKSRSSFYFSLARGLWTKPVKLSQRSVGWPASEVNLLIKALIAGLDEHSLREIVLDLERARTQSGESV
jgi:prophage regulatory protein